MSRRELILIGPAVGVVLITLALVVGYVVVPPIIIQRVTESVQLIVGTEQYDRWVEVPQPLDFKVYIFNVTNVAEVQQGKVPQVVELGPYVYTQTRKKNNIRFTRDRERASYFSQMTFHFNAEKSYPYTEDDDITVLNIHMNSILQIVDKVSRQMISNVTRGVEKTIDRIPVINIVKRMLDRFTPLQSIIQTVEGETPFFLSLINDQMANIFGPTDSFFLRTTPRKFLFEGVEFCVEPDGIAEVICQMVQDRNSATIKKVEGRKALRFSMFNHLNVTHDGLYEINTGIRRLNRLLRIERWNNARTLSQWKPDSKGAPSVCQFINGTDATAAPPFRQQGDDFYIFSSDICRSVHLVYDERVTFNGIRAYRYSTRDNFLNQVDKCFCINKIQGALVQEDGCLYSGALDLTDCLDAPVVGTMPHFLGADEKYEKMVDGLNPTPERHNIFMDVEPFTGTPIRGGKKLQFNMFLKKIESITLTNNFVSPRLVPALWVDEGLELNDEMSDLIKGDLTYVLLTINIVQWTLVGIGIALVVGMLIWYFIARNNASKTSVSSVNLVTPVNKADLPTEK